jgi:hypothetical protein
MPDLMTHCLAGYVATRRWVLHPLAYVFLVGTVLPDALGRTFSIIVDSTHRWATPVHTPVGQFVICWTLAQCFRAGQRRRVFACLFAGSALHLLLDATQKHVAGGYLFLFPFSWATWKGGLWWPEDSLLVLPYLLLAVALCEAALYARRRARHFPR